MIWWQPLAISNLSKSQVSRMAEELDEMVDDFRNRPLDPGGYAYLCVMLLRSKVREGGRVVTCSVLLATAESNASWKGFFQDFKARGLTGVFLVTSDAHDSIQHAISEVLADTS